MQEFKALIRLFGLLLCQGTMPCLRDVKPFNTIAALHQGIETTYTYGMRTFLSRFRALIVDTIIVRSDPVTIVCFKFFCPRKQELVDQILIGDHARHHGH